MMSFVGAVLILIAGTLFGFQKAAGFAERPTQIRQLTHALQRLETEIDFAATPLPEALLRTAEGSPEPLAAMLRQVSAQVRRSEERSFSEVWEDAVTQHWRETSMGTAERGIVLRLGTTLGISDREDQLKHLKHAVVGLRSEEETARDDQRRYEKMWKSLGLLIAALVVILMV